MQRHKWLVNKKILTISIGIIVGLVLIVHISNLLIVRNIEIKGNDYLKEEVILNVLPKGNITLWSLDKKKVLQNLSQNIFIENIALKTKYFRNLEIEVKLVPLIGETEQFGKKEYITEKGKYLTGDFINQDIFLPTIILSKETKHEKILYLSQQLAIIKFNYPEFFKKINKIDLLDLQNVSIFIVNDALGMLREYKLYHIPSVQDFLKIQIVDGKYNQGSVIILDGDSVIIQD